MSVRINRVYTRTGDNGTTRLARGRKVAKSDLRVEAYGRIDGLGAHLGYLVELVRADVVLQERLQRIQQELFDLGSLVATLPEDLNPERTDLPKLFVARLEQEIDGWNDALPELQSFILSGGGMASAWCHVCRTVCRDCERAMVAAGDMPVAGLGYINRLSDYLFVLARHLAAKSDDPELLWKQGRTDTGES